MRSRRTGRAAGNGGSCRRIWRRGCTVCALRDVVLINQRSTYALEVRARCGWTVRASNTSPLDAPASSCIAVLRRFFHQCSKARLQDRTEGNQAEGIQVVRLGKEDMGIVSEFGRASLASRRSAEKNDRSFFVMTEGADKSEKVEAVHLRQVHVENDQVAGPGSEVVERNL